jgi:hypothetical protein
MEGIAWLYRSFIWVILANRFAGMFDRDRRVTYVTLGMGERIQTVVC